MKKILISATIALLVGLLVTMAAQAAPPQPFYIEKTCDLPYSCLLHDADTYPFTVLNGGRIYYFDRAYFANPAGNAKESADVLLVSADGNSMLRGHVSWVLHDGDFYGRYTLYEGTGELAGLHVQGVVGVLDWTTFTFFLKGTYH